MRDSVPSAAFVMYCVNGESGSSLLIESTNSMIPNSVAIIDGTDIFIQRPSNLTTQKSSYSDYKSHTTVKYLLAIDTFTGVFVSFGFSGNSSDCFTIEHSRILDVL